jgi:hypothetical protein
MLCSPAYANDAMTVGSMHDGEVESNTGTLWLIH